MTNPAKICVEGLGVTGCRDGVALRGFKYKGFCLCSHRPNKHMPSLVSVQLIVKVQEFDGKSSQKGMEGKECQ